MSPLSALTPDYDNLKNLSIRNSSLLGREEFVSGIKTDNHSSKVTDVSKPSRRIKMIFEEEIEDPN